MSLIEVWPWLGLILDYSIQVFGILATVFFYFAVFKERHALLYGILGGISVIMEISFFILLNLGKSILGFSFGIMSGFGQFTVSIIFLIIGIVLIFLALDIKNNVKHKEAYNSTFLLTIIFFIISFYLLVPSLTLFFKNQPGNTWQDLLPAYSLTYPFPFDLVLSDIIPITLFALGIYVIKETKFKFSNPNKEQGLDENQKPFSKLDLEISRKIFHVIIIVLLICYLFVGRVVVDTIYQYTFLGMPKSSSGPSGQEIYDNLINNKVLGTGILNFRAGHLLLLMAIAWILIILLFTDFIRIKKFRYYPFKMLAKVYRDKERLVLAPHIYLTAGILFIVMLSSAIDQFLNIAEGISVHIVMMTILVSALADAVATIVGITKGQHYLKGGRSKKTWEGLLAGFLSAILIALLSYLVLMPQYGGFLLQGIFFALIAGFIFSLIDYFSPPIPISDNILNPIAIALTLWGVWFLFFF